MKSNDQLNAIFFRFVRPRFVAYTVKSDQLTTLKKHKKHVALKILG